MSQSVGRKSNLRSSHDIHFSDIIGDMIKAAYENELLNRSNTYRPKGSGVHKKSSVQNGAAATACLLIFITFESMIRRAYYFQDISYKEKSHSEDLWWVIKNLKPGIHLDASFKKYLEDLNLLRDIIVHAYIFEGTLEWNEEHKLVAINERVVAGKEKKRVGRARLTKELKLHKSPNQISFSDAAKFYLTFEVLLVTVGIPEPYELWPWDGDDLEPFEWLHKASSKLGYSNSLIWKELREKKENEEFKGFLNDVGDMFD